MPRRLRTGMRWRYHSWEGPNPAVHLDGSYRRIPGTTLLEGAASEDLAVPQQTVDGLGAPATIPSDNDSCFAGGSRQSGVRTPILYEDEPPRLETVLINPMPYGLSVNERPERFHKDLGGGIRNFPCLDDHVACDAGPLRLSPGINCSRAPLATSRKSTSDKTTQAKPYGGRYR